MTTSINFENAWNSTSKEYVFAIGFTKEAPKLSVCSLFDLSNRTVYPQSNVMHNVDVTAGVLQGEMLTPYVFVVADHPIKSILQPYWTT